MRNTSLISQLLDSHSLLAPVLIFQEEERVPDEAWTVPSRWHNREPRPPRCNSSPPAHRGLQLRDTAQEDSGLPFSPSLSFPRVSNYQAGLRKRRVFRRPPLPLTRQALK